MNALARIPLLLPLLLPALAPPLPAAVPERWKAEASDARPHLAEAYRGETLSLECSLVDGGRPLDLAGASASLHWQTNGMGALWWEAPAAVTDGAVRAAFSPAMDCGAEAYRFFLRVSDAVGVSYRANGTLRMLESPGATPSALPLPRQSLDFAAIEVLNAPWASSLADLSGDSDHMLVSASEKEAWNDKADAEDLPTKTSDLENDGDGTSLFATLDELGNVSDTANAAGQAAQQALDGLGGKAASSDVVLVRRTEYSAWTPIRELTDEEKELFYAEDPSSAQDNYAITVEDTPTANGGAWYVYVGGWRVGVAGSDATGLRLDAISGYPPYLAVFGYPNTLVATRTQTVLPGYILGNQSDKPLQEAGDYAALSDIPPAVADTIASSDTWLTISNGTCRIYTSATNDLGETVASNVWSSAEASEGMPDAAATNALWQAIRTLNQSWGDYAPDGSGNPDPEYQVLVNTPALSLASGFRWATAGTYAVLAASGAVAFAAGNSGQLRIGSDVSTNYFGYVEGGLVTVGCSAAAIAMGQDDTVEIVYPYSGGDFPVVWFSASLSEPSWAEVSPVWTDNGDGTATATCAATTDAGFYKATTSATSSPQFISTMPINAAGGIIGGDLLDPVVYDATITIQSGGHTYRIPAELVE